ncbi:DUF6643 family protein [Streptomyces sp. NPDC004838]
MTSPRVTYGGSGYYSAPSFADTPIYDSLVAERGTPQIAPIRVPSAYDTGNSYLPALPAALPALPAAPHQQANAYGYQQQMPQPMPLQQAAAPYIPQQPSGPRGYPGPQGQPQRPAATGYEAMRPAAARPAPPPAQGPGAYNAQYNRPHPGQGY